MAFAITHDVILNPAVSIAVLLEDGSDYDFWKIHQDIVQGWGINLEFFYAQEKALVWLAQQGKYACSQNQWMKHMFV